MSKDSDAPPPYFNISPDAALAELDTPMGTADLARLAEACNRGRADLASRGLGEAGEKQLRLFSTWEITRYLIPVAVQHFRRRRELTLQPALKLSRVGELIQTPPVLHARCRTQRL